MKSQLCRPYVHLYFSELSITFYIYFYIYEKSAL
jgi:hypothetical protein